MGKFKDLKDKRIHKLDVRLTTDEYNKILSEMKQYGYISVSKYVRERLLKKRVTYKKQIVTDRDIKNQINKLSTEISRIGSNYNKIVKKYQAVCNAKRADGSDVINTRSTNYYMHNLHKLTLQVKGMMEKVIDTVSPPEDNQIIDNDINQEF